MTAVQPDSEMSDLSCEDPAVEPVSIIAELGLRTAADGPVVRGAAEVVPELCVPGTSTLRTSVVATWADVVTGYVAGRSMDPRIPLTLDLEVQIHGTVRAGDRVVCQASALKVGRTVVVCEARFHDDSTGALLAIALGSFVASPDQSHVFPGGFPCVDQMMTGRLAQPLAERIGGRTIERGRVEVPHRPDGLNASGAIQGGIVAFAVEEAVMSLVDRPVVIESINLRYLRPFSIGPAQAVAEDLGELAVVHLTDMGSGKLSAVATVRWRTVE
jgi:acyl-coenzyme A thioesterase PaaI-like protein